MFDFGKMTKWTLSADGHDFPGPDGGTCVTEAAIVAAGFPYVKVDSVCDCPPCFSRPIAQYASSLNDDMPDELRQTLLLPFVTRLAGTADTSKIEAKRGQFMAREASRRVLSLFCEDMLERRDLAERCRNATDLREAKKVCRLVEVAVDALCCRSPASAWMESVTTSAKEAAAYAFGNRYMPGIAPVAAADFAASVVIYASYRSFREEEYLAIGTQILDEAIMLGKHPTLDDVELVNRRLDKAKRNIAA